jgi:uncharacterized membrane protein YphA (DoxX/SURF4 family)
MWTDAFARNAIAPLILRVVLAVIFIYHGWHKITDRDNEWGAAWANATVDRSEAPPEPVLARLNQWVEMHKQKRDKADAQPSEQLLPDDIAERVREAYAALRAPEVIHQQPSQGDVQMQSSVQMLVAWGELIGGVALLLGLLTRFAALGMIVIQIGAIYLVTGTRGFSVAGAAGYEYNVALLGMCATLVFLGSGTLALNRLFVPHRRPGAPAARSEPAPVVTTS